ncbi:tape measure protein [Caproiciproducens galactitolivorans]|uniref:Tape measure protein N-terminal domain-containing protein n=1 Tax=Caproiciproducens galactitolivorans TaxID=642589 RepID=A0A4Z0Y871_9FIRM|nr:tape measure protein [Caproiciproducens galactitolivorans]TGJ75481.1 hypothetical protein CAGA_23600 [Caproiciproducens galactitolivorans]
MPSLRSIFTLQDNYSRQMDRIWNSTECATKGIAQASSAVDNVNSKFTATESSAGRLTSRLTGLAAAFLSIETLKKGMEISDTYTNISSKLSLITSNAAQLKSLQNDIFAAADRARGSYTDMADTVAKLGIIAGSQFGSNQNIVKFTETMQKMFKIGGTPVANQAGALLQLQQAIGLGKLQGQDLRILAEDAPLVETAIAKYMGKSVGEVKELGTEGKITSQVLINSILQYSSTVDQQMGKMKYTWGDYWNKIKNGAYQAFRSAFENENSVLGSQKFQNMINGIIGSFSVLASVANGVLTAVSNVGGFIAQNWSIIAPIIGGVAAIMLTVWAVTKGIALAQAAWAAITGIWELVMAGANIVLGMFTGVTFAAADAQTFFNGTLLACPLTWILLLIIAVIAVIYIVIAIINKVTGQTISATGVIVGCLNWVWTLIKNVGLQVADFAVGVWDAAQVLIHNIGIAFPNLWADLKTGFLGFVTMIFNGVKAVADAINRIPGMKMDTSGLANMINSNISKMAALQKNKGKYEDIGAAFQKGMGTFNVDWASLGNGKAYMAGYKTGRGIDTSVSNWMKNLGKLPPQKAPPYIPTPTYGGGDKDKPVKVKGTGADGSVKVNIADQDLQYLRDLAEKQYINKFSTAVLSPKLSVSFSGNVGDKDDQQKIYSTISRMLKEELATAAEGLYE